MIGRLRGLLLEKQPPHLLLDVNGVGYEVQAPMSTFYQLPELGEEATLHTHFVVREDAQLLYGFHNSIERRLFRTLIKVNGVGPKLALGILSGMGVDDFVSAVGRGDATTLVKLPGVGKKTAERLVVEMRDRLKDWSSEETPVAAVAEIRQDQLRGAVVEAEDALCALGYKPTESAKAVNAALREGVEQNSEALIRAALKGMISK